MAPSKIDNGTVLIIDIGKNVSDPEEKNGKSFFEKARECAIRIIERKVISQGKNLLGMILLGSKKTKNNLAESGGCRHIEMYSDLQYPTWQMIRDFPDKPSKAKGNWFDALLVAVDQFKNGFTSLKISNKQIMLMTNFLEPCDVEASEIEQAVSGLREEGFQVDIIGPDIYDNENKNSEFELAKQFVEGTNGVTATFEFTMRYLLFHKKKAVNPIPWNVDLSIGSTIKIPVSTYIRIKDEPVIKKWSVAIRDPVTNSKSNTEYVDKSKILVNTENQMIVDPDKNIKGYLYGQQVIPFSDFDKGMLYDSGPKSLTVYGFTKASKITWQCLNGDGLSYVFGRKGDKKAQYAVRCLVECLLELKLVGIVRRVYNNGNAPKMYALMPVIDSDNYVCLSMIGICFKEEIKNMAFPSTELKKFECTNEQVNAFKELIRNMDLTKAYEDTEFDDTEAFPIAKMVSPSAQYVLDCLAFRALNPGKPLPPPRDDITMLFRVPPLIEKRRKQPLDELKSLFVLNKVEIKKRVKTKTNEAMDDKASTSNTYGIGMDNLPKIDINSLKKSNQVTKISTWNAINDFDALKREGIDIKDLAPQMIEAIESMIFGNIDGNYSKALEVMSHFRHECLNAEPSYYNNWLKKIRVELIDRNRNDIISMVNEKKLNYIVKSENSLSKLEFDTFDDSQLYETDTVPNLTQLTISSEVNDLFDNM
ncbi:X-ray repair cross-complementing protein 5-like [Nymphalis io]|uniref:X-ray repair cross-complementing protein 5-like n=1 Tax=Inachis io TaxID=171585 RepID=UPI002168332D|nr:X-ray repair cross-complementing protein 5-like [Nymphalis io]